MEYTDIKIVSVELMGDFQLKLGFNNSEYRIVDLEPVLYGGLFGELRNPELFKSVRVNKDVHTIEWPNGADFHPETLYNWENHKESMASAAAKRKFKESA